jgi:hypothetical protein
MDKLKQYKEFLTKLKGGETEFFDFYIDMDWYERHGNYEDKYGEWIEGVTERLIDGDDGRSWFNFYWDYNKDKDEFYCSMESDLDSKEIILRLEGEEELRDYFLDEDDLEEDEDSEEDLEKNEEFMRFLKRPKIRINFSMNNEKEENDQEE